MANHEHTTANDQAEAAKQAAVMKEMLPFFIMAAIPIFITILIAYIFGPTV